MLSKIRPLVFLFLLPLMLMAQERRADGTTTNPDNGVTLVTAQLAPIDQNLNRASAESRLQAAGDAAGLPLDLKNFVFATQNDHGIASAAVAGMENLTAADFKTPGGLEVAVVWIPSPGCVAIAGVNGLYRDFTSGYYTLRVVDDGTYEGPTGVLTNIEDNTVNFAIGLDIDEAVPQAPGQVVVGFENAAAFNALPLWWWPRFTYCWGWGWGCHIFPSWYNWVYWGPWRAWHWWYWRFDWHWRWWGFGLYIPYIYC